MASERAYSGAEVVMAGFAGIEPPPLLLSLIGRGLAGVILFARNAVSPEQVAELTASLQARARQTGWPPLLIGIDHEGGRVQRLRTGVTVLPAPMAVGAAGDEGLAYQLAATAGTELRNLGLNLNFAPCADVNTNPRNPVIGTRSYGSHPGQVAQLVAATVRGYQDHGVLATAKHFPGHGDTHQDSHHTLPQLARDEAGLRALDLPPFAAAIAAGAAAVMSAHIVVGWLTGDKPATLSRAALTGLLREELGFEGLVLTDCLEMRAILDNGGPSQATLQALAAGADLTLWSHTPAYQEEAVAAAGAALAGHGPVAGLVVRTAAGRVRRIREGLEQGPSGSAAKPGALAPAAAGEAAQAVYRRSTTLVAAQPGLLPLPPGSRVIVVATGGPAAVPGEAQAARDASSAGFAGSSAAPYELVRELQARGVDAVAMRPGAPSPTGIPIVLLTSSACAETTQLEAARAITGAASGPVVHVATGLPYDLGLLPQARTRLATFDGGTGSIRALAEVLAGGRPSVGRLPVSLPNWQDEMR